MTFDSPSFDVPEASKLVMSYVAAVCGKGQEVNKVKEQLLQSNPVLEGEYALKLCVCGVCVCVCVCVCVFSSPIIPYACLYLITYLC